MSQLDILTPRGKETVEQERRAAALFNRATGYHYAYTDKSLPIDYDALIYDPEFRIVAIVETKCRRMTLHDLVGWDMEWLITADKLERCVHEAERRGVAFYGFLYIVDSDLLLTQRIWAGGRYVVNIRYAVTETQATVNGGKARRRNAFIDMMQARSFSGEMSYNKNDDRFFQNESVGTRGDQARRGNHGLTPITV